MSGTLTINIVSPGTTEINPTNGQVSPSFPGHIWYTVTDANGKKFSFGFDPIKQNSPYSAGQVVNNDSTVYQGMYFSQSASLTDAQVQALITYGTSTENLALAASGGIAGPVDPTVTGFNTTYNVLGGAFGIQGAFGNNCISYVNGALKYAGITSGPLMSAIMFPAWNAGAAAAILNNLENQNNGSTVTTTVKCGDNDEYTCTITGNYSSPNSSGVRTLLGDTWTSSDGSHGIDTYNSPNNFTSSVINRNGSSSIILDSNGSSTFTALDASGNIINRINDDNNAVSVYDYGTGKITSDTTYQRDGSYVVTTYDTAGNKNADTLFDANGTQIGHGTWMWLPNATATGGLWFVMDYNNANSALLQTASFNPDGTQHFRSVYHPNGTYDEYDYEGNGRLARAQTLTFSGQWVSSTLYGTDGSYETKTYGPGATTIGTITGDSRYNAEGIKTYQASFAPDGRMIEETYFDDSGHKSRSITYQSTPGSTDSVTGMVTTFFNPDGSTAKTLSTNSAGSVETDYHQDGSWDVTTTVSQNGKIAEQESFGSNGNLVSKTDYYNGGNAFNPVNYLLKRTVWNADGTSTATNYTSNGQVNNVQYFDKSGTLKDTVTQSVDTTGRLNVTVTQPDGKYFTTIHQNTDPSSAVVEQDWIDVNGEKHVRTPLAGHPGGFQETFHDKRLGNVELLQFAPGQDVVMALANGVKPLPPSAANVDFDFGTVSPSGLVGSGPSAPPQTGLPPPVSSLPPGGGGYVTGVVNDPDSQTSTWTFTNGSTVTLPYGAEPPDPVILNLQGGPVQTQGSTNSVAHFDMNNDGQKVSTGWMTPGEGMLVYDPQNRNQISQDADLVGGFGRLTTFDSNGDGVLDTRDAAWSALKVWVDPTGTADFHQGDLYSMAQLGISSINLHGTTGIQNSNGNEILASSTFTRTDGSTGAIAGVALQATTDPAAIAAANLVQAMAAFAPPAPGTTGLTPDQQKALEPLLAANLH